MKNTTRRTGPKVMDEQNEDLVFLGGTCNDSTWRTELKSMLRVRYFDPVVEDWNEDAYRLELKMRKNASIVLYTITPEMTGVYSIAEVVDDSNKRPESTVFCVLNEANGKVFEPSVARSLNAVAKMVVANGGTYCSSLEECAEILNNL